MNSAIFLAFDLNLGGNAPPALAARQQAAKPLWMICGVLGRLLPRLKSFLCFVEKLFGDKRWMLAFVKLPVIAEEADIKRVGKHEGNLVALKRLAAFALPPLRRLRLDAAFVEKRRDVLKPRIAFGVEFKRPPDNGSLAPVHDDDLAGGIVHIADGRDARIFAPLNFFVKSALSVNRQVADVLRRRRKLNRHEQSVVIGLIVVFVGADLLYNANLMKPAYLPVVPRVAG